MVKREEYVCSEEVDDNLDTIAFGFTNGSYNGDLQFSIACVSKI